VEVVGQDLQLTLLRVVLAEVLEMVLELKERELAAKVFRVGLALVVVVAHLLLELMVTEET
jgi:hypothetical protein